MDPRSLKTIQRVTTFACTFGCAFSYKYGISMTTLSIYDDPVLITFTQVNQNRIIKQIPVENLQFKGISQLDQDYACIKSNSEGWVKFYSLSSLDLVYQKLFHLTPTDQVYYYQDTNQVFAISQNKVYYGVLNLETGEDKEIYKINSSMYNQFSYPINIIMVDNLDMFMIYQSFPPVQEIYQKSTGILLQRLELIIFFYWETFHTLLFYINEEYSYNIFNLNSLLDERYIINNKNQNVLPKLYDTSSNTIYAISLVNQIYQIDLEKHKMIHLLKRNNPIISIQKLSDFIIIQTSQEIIFQNHKIDSKPYRSIQIFSHQLQVIQYSNLQDSLQKFQLIIARFPKIICAFIGNFDGIKLEYSAEQCVELVDKISEIIPLNYEFTLILHINGNISIFNNNNQSFTTIQKCHEKKFYIFLLPKLYKSDDLTESNYILSYSIDKNIKIHSLQIKKEDRSYQLKEIVTFTYQKKISQIILTSDQKEAIVSFQDERFIRKICIECQINNTSSSKYNIFLLPFSRYQYQIQFYEKYNCLLVYSNEIYIVYDYLLTHPIFVSTANYLNNNINDIILLNQSQIVIATANSLQLLNLKIDIYKNFLLSETEILFNSSQQQVKIFSTFLKTIPNDDSYQTFNFVGYNLVTNQMVFYKIPIVSNQNSLSCTESFLNPLSINIQNKIDEFKYLDSQMLIKVNKYIFQLILNNTLLDNSGNYISTAYPLSIPYFTKDTKQSLEFTGTNIYLDKINFTDLQNYYDSISFSDAQIFIKDSQQIKGFAYVSFKRCSIFILKSVSDQSFSILFIQNSIIELDTVSISDQKIPDNFLGITFQQDFDTLKISNLNINNNVFNQSTQLFKISQGKTINIDDVTINNNTFQSESSNQLFFIERVDQIALKAGNINNNRKKQTNKDSNLNYFIKIASSQNIEIINFKFLSNKNCSFFYYPNTIILQEDNQVIQLDYIEVQLTLNDIVQESNIYDAQIEDPLIQIMKVQNLKLLNSKFNTNIIQSSSILMLNEVQFIQIEDTSFLENNLNSCLQVSVGDSIQFKNTNFTDNSSLKSGAALYLAEFKKSGQNFIKNCNFIKNYSKDEGGSILFYNVDIDIEQSKFINNTSSIGGAIRYKGMVPNFIKQLTQQRNLQQNNIQFSGNKAMIFGNNIGSYPHKIVLQQDYSVDLQHLNLQDYRSGDNNATIILILLDEEGQIIRANSLDKSNSEKIKNEISEYTITLNTIEKETLEIKDKLSFNYTYEKESYHFNLNGMKLVGNPTKSAQFKISAPFVQQTNGNIIFTGSKDYNVTVNFRECEIGEIYVNINSNKTYECSPCNNQLYSLIKPLRDSNQACKSCSQEGISFCEKNIILLQNGYWRKSQDEDQVFKCINKLSNCYGDIEHGYCVKGYIGPRCEACDNYGTVWNESYGKVDDYTCNSCNEPAQIYLRQFLHLLFISIYLMYSVKKSIDKASKFIICQTLRRMNSLLIGRTGEKDQVSFYIKLLINFVQVTSVLQSSQFEFIKFDSFKLESIFGSPSQFLSNSFDCSLSKQNSLPIEFIRGIWVSIQPIILLIITIILFIIMSPRKSNKQDRKRFFFAAYTFGFIQFQCSTAIQIVLIMSCQRIGSDYYIKSQMNKACYSEEHLKYTLSIILPLFLLWVIFIPIFILWRISIKKTKLAEPIQVYKYGFICGDYKKTYFYWEFFRIVLRLTIVLVGNVLSDTLITLKISLSIVFIQIYNHFLLKFSPYINKSSQQLDFKYNQAISLLFLLYLISKTSENTDVSATSAFIQFLLTVVCHVTFIMLIISFTVNNNIPLNQFLRKKLPFTQKWIQKPSVGLRKFILWKKIKDHFDKYYNDKIEQLKQKDSQQNAFNNQNQYAKQIFHPQNGIQEVELVKPQSQKNILLDNQHSPSSQNIFSQTNSFSTQLFSIRTPKVGKILKSGFGQQPLQKSTNTNNNDENTAQYEVKSDENSPQNELIFSQLILDESVHINQIENKEFIQQQNVIFSKFKEVGSQKTENKSQEQIQSDQGILSTNRNIFSDQNLQFEDEIQEIISNQNKQIQQEQ